MTVSAPPLPPQPSIGRVNPNGTPTQAQIDYERQFSKWVRDYIASVVGGALPFPTPTTLGGVKSATALTHQFQRGVDGTGSPLFAQPAAADISGLGPFATASTVPAASVTGLATVATSGMASDLSGSLPVPTPTPTTLGGIYSGSAPALSFSTGVDTSGNIQYRQPSFNDIGGQVLTAQLPFPGASSLGGVNSLAAVSHKFLTSIGTDGVPVAAQPAFSDLSGSLSTLTIGTHLSGTSYNGSANVTIATDATDANTASTIVARDASGNFSAGTITASLTGAASLNLLKTNNLGDLASAKTARSSAGLNIEAGTAHGNSDYTILSTDRWVYTNAAFTAPRIWTLPAASSLNAGQSVIIDDLQNTLSLTNTIIITRAGSDLINALSTLTLNAAGIRCVLISDGTSKWTATLSVTGVTGTGADVLSNSPTITGLALISSATIATLGATSLTVTGTGNVATLTATTATIGTLTANTVGSAFANLSNTTSAAQLHLSGTGNDDGAYLVGHGTNGLELAAGGSYDGTNWTAKATSFGNLAIVNGAFTFYSGSGLTIGNVFFPSTAFAISSAGIVTTGTWNGATIDEAHGGTGDTGTAWTSYSPIATAGSGSFTTLGTVSGSWKKIGKTTFVQGDISITTNGTAASSVQCTLPTTAKSGKLFMNLGKEVNVTGAALIVTTNAGAASCGIVTTAAGYPGGTGYRIVFSLVYESA